MDVLDSKVPQTPHNNGGEIRLNARSMSRGVAIGRVVCLHGNSHQFFKLEIDDSKVAREVRRARAGFRLARRQLNKLKTDVLAGMSSVPGILDAQKAMIEDSSLLSQVESVIDEQRVNAEWAVKVVTDTYVSKYKAIEDQHIREKYIDVEDVADRILSALGGGERSLRLADDSIIVAKELMPSTLAEQSGSHPSAIITEHGGWTSHTFILARELNLPAVTGVKKILRRVDTGANAIVDGFNGRVILNPDPETLEQYRLPVAQFKQVNYNDVTVADATTRTLDGVEVTLRVNVDLPEVYKKAKRLGARGIGLYRSEFLFNRFKSFPTENQQFEAYREIADFAGSDGVKIRTFDLSPEQVYGQSHGREKNPALGLRAIRLGLADVKQLRSQVRAILRASHGRVIDIVVPMVSGIDEISQVTAVVDRERKNLIAKDTPVGTPRIGAMVEVPSAVLLIDEILAEADFVCLGTNDLVQYLLAVDRDNEAVSNWFRTLHPGVIRAIKTVIGGAEKAGKTVVICGEMAGSPFYAPLLIGLGATELSMNVNSLLRVRKVISGLARAETEELAEAVSRCRTADEVEVALETNISEKWSHLIQPQRRTKPHI